MNTSQTVGIELIQRADDAADILAEAIFIIGVVAKRVVEIDMETKSNEGFMAGCSRMVVCACKGEQLGQRNGDDGQVRGAIMQYL